MSAIAEVMLARGYSVQGIDLNRAASSGGNVGYPPKPTSAWGRIRPRCLYAVIVPFISIYAVFINPIGDRFPNVAEGIW